MIYIIDFDGTIFNITTIGLKINKNKIISRKELSKKLGLRLNNNILLTGRSERRKNELLPILKEKGYLFNKVIFRDFSLANPITIRKKYLDFKIRQIQSIIASTNENVIVIDNDKGVIKRCNQLGIKTINFSISDEDI